MSSNEIEDASREQTVTYFGNFGSEKVTSGNMSVAKLLDEFLALSAFSRSGSAEDEGDLGVAEHVPYVWQLDVGVAHSQFID